MSLITGIGTSGEVVLAHVSTKPQKFRVFVYSDAPYKISFLVDKLGPCKDVWIKSTGWISEARVFFHLTVPESATKLASDEIETQWAFSIWPWEGSKSATLRNKVSFQDIAVQLTKSVYQGKVSCFMTVKDLDCVEWPVQEFEEQTIAITDANKLKPRLEARVEQHSCRNDSSVIWQKEQSMDLFAEEPMNPPSKTSANKSVYEERDDCKTDARDSSIKAGETYDQTHKKIMDKIDSMAKMCLRSTPSAGKASNTKPDKTTYQDVLAKIESIKAQLTQPKS